MREILFRGKRLDNGQWAYGNLIASDDVVKEYEAIIIPRLNSDIFTSAVTAELGVSKWYTVDPNTVCEYTGRKCYSENDNDIHLIFDGDIVDVTTFDNEGYDYHRLCEVKWIEGGFALINDKESFFTWIGNVDDPETELSLYGNIFDNPELLERKV